MLISIIITTKNEARNIENCIKSILGQSYKDLEIIVVDNNSTDRTKEIAKKYTDKVYDKGPERSAQRNFGVAQSGGEYFLYLDADMILSPDVVKECVERLESYKLKLQLNKLDNPSAITRRSNNKTTPSSSSTLKLDNFQLDNLVALYIPEIIMGESF